MSREHLTDQAHQGIEAQGTQQNGDIQGLPPRIYGLAMALRPGDVAGLRTLLWEYEFLSQQILAVVSPHVGASTVQRAIRSMPTKAEGRSGALGNSGTVEMDGESNESDEAKLARLSPKKRAIAAEVEGSSPQAEATGAPDSTPEGESDEAMLARLSPKKREIAAEVEGSSPQETTSTPEGESDEAKLARLSPKKREIAAEVEGSSPQAETTSEPAGESDEAKLARLSPKKRAIAAEVEGSSPQATEPFWVADARRYNAVHTTFVEEFNDLTKNLCLDSGTGALDPIKVSNWQDQRGLAADGKVGRQTVAAARHTKMASAETAEALDARPPV